VTSSHFLPRSQGKRNRSRKTWGELTRCGNRSLIDSLGLTTKLRDYNIPREDIPQIVERTIGKSSGELHDQLMEIMDTVF